MVAEKNSIARAITIAFGVNYKSNKGRVSCFYFSGEFRGQRANFRVTATNGHLYGRDFPKEYADWVFIYIKNNVNYENKKSI